MDSTSCLLCYSGSSRTSSDIVPFSVDGIGIDGSTPVVWSPGDKDKKGNFVCLACSASLPPQDGNTTTSSSLQSDQLSLAEITAAIFADPAVNPERKRLLALWLQSNVDNYPSLPVPKLVSFVRNSSSSSRNDGKEEDHHEHPSASTTSSSSSSLVQQPQPSFGDNNPPVPLETVTNSPMFTQALVVLQDILQENIHGGKQRMDDLLLTDIIPVVFQILSASYTAPFDTWTLTKDERNQLKNDFKNAGGKDTVSSIPILRSTLISLVSRHIPNCSSLVKAIVNTLLINPEKSSSSSNTVSTSSSPALNAFTFGISPLSPTSLGEATPKAEDATPKPSGTKFTPSPSITTLADALLDGKSKAVFDKVKETITILANHGYVPSYKPSETPPSIPVLQVPTLNQFNACTSQPSLVYNPSTGANDTKPGASYELSTLEILVRYSEPFAKCIPLPPEKATATSTTTASTAAVVPAYIDDGYGQDDYYPEDGNEYHAQQHMEDEEGMQVYDPTTYTYVSSTDKKKKGSGTVTQKKEAKKPFSGGAITSAILNRSDLFSLGQAFTLLSSCIDILRLIINPYRKLLPNSVLLLDLLFLGGPTTLYTSITGVASHCASLATTATANTAIKGSITLSVRSLAITDTPVASAQANAAFGYQQATTALTTLPFENHVIVTTLQASTSSTSAASTVASPFGGAAPVSSSPNSLGLGSINMQSALGQLSSPSGYYNGSTYVHPMTQAGSVPVDVFGKSSMEESLLQALEIKSAQIQESIDTASAAAAVASGYGGGSSYRGGRGGARGGRGGGRGGGKTGRGGHKGKSRSKSSKSRSAVTNRIQWSLLLPHYRNAVVSTSSTMLGEPMMNCDCILYGLLVLRIKESGILRALTTVVGRLLAQVAAMDDNVTTATSNIGSSSSSGNITVKDIGQVASLSRVCISIFYGCGTTSITDSLASTIKAFDKTISSLSFANYPAVFTVPEKAVQPKLSSNAAYTNLNALSTAADNFKLEEESFAKDGKDRRLYTAIRKAIGYVTNETIHNSVELPAVLFNLERIGRLCIPVLTPFSPLAKTDNTKTNSFNDDDDTLLPSPVAEASSASSSATEIVSSTSVPSKTVSYTDTTKTLLYAIAQKLDSIAQARVTPFLRLHHTVCPNRHAYRLRAAQRQLSLIENDQPTNAIITQNVNKPTGNVNLTLGSTVSPSSDRDIYWTNYAYDSGVPRKVLQKQNTNVRNMIDIALSSALRLLSYDLQESTVDPTVISSSLDTLATFLPNICETAAETLEKALVTEKGGISVSSSSSSSSSNLIIVSSSDGISSTGTKAKVEVTKTFEGVNAVLDLVETLAAHSSMIPVLLTAPPSTADKDTAKIRTTPCTLIKGLETNPKTGKLVIEAGCLAETITSVQPYAKEIVAKADKRKTKLLAKQAALQVAEEKQRILASARKAAKEAAQEAKETAIKLIQEKRKNAKSKSTTVTVEETVTAVEPEAEEVELTKSGRPKRKPSSKVKTGLVVKESKGMVKSKTAASKKSSKNKGEAIRYSMLPFASSLFSYIIFQSTTTAGYTTVLDVPVTDFLDPDYQESTYCSLCSKYFEAPLYVLRHMFRKHPEYLVSFAAPMEIQIAAAAGEIDDCIKSTFAPYYSNDDDDAEDDDNDSLWDELEFMDDEDAAELKAASSKSKKSKGKKGKKKAVSNDDDGDDDSNDEDSNDDDDDTESVLDFDEKGDIKETMVVQVARRILRILDKVLDAITVWTSDPNHVIVPTASNIASSLINPTEEVVSSTTVESSTKIDTAPVLSRTISNGSVNSEFGSRATIDPVWGILGRTSSLVPGSSSVTTVTTRIANTDPVLMVPPNEIVGENEKSSIFVRRQLGHSSIRQARVYVPRDVRSAYLEAMGDERYFVVEGLKNDHEFKKGGFSTAGVGTPSQSGQFHTKHKKQMSNELRNFETDTSIISWGSSILVRADASDIDIIRAVITGADCTPYANGFFVYDIFVPPAYPTVSPMVVITTRGHGKARFNPNLYSNGKVCLSLLGTWSGPGWTPETSTIYQVLLSIQSIVMNRWPQENEPSMESTSKTLIGKLQTSIYHMDIRIATLRFAMLEHLLRPAIGFERAIKVHFYYKRDEIKAQAILWAEEAILLARYQIEMYRLQAMDPTVILKRVKKLITHLNEKRSTSLAASMTPSYSVFESGDSMDGVYIPNNLPLAPTAVTNRFNQLGSLHRSSSSNYGQTSMWTSSSGLGKAVGGKSVKKITKKTGTKKYQDNDDEDNDDDDDENNDDDNVDELSNEDDDDADITLPKKKGTKLSSTSSTTAEFSALKDLPFDEALKSYLQGIYPGSIPTVQDDDEAYIETIMYVCFPDNPDEDNRGYAIKAYYQAIKNSNDYNTVIVELSEHITKFNEEYNNSETIPSPTKKGTKGTSKANDDETNENTSSSAFTFTKAAKKTTKKSTKITEEEEEEETSTSNVEPPVKIKSMFGNYGRGKNANAVPTSNKPYEGPRNIADLAGLLWKLRLRVVQSNLHKTKDTSTLSSLVIPDNATNPSPLSVLPPSLASTALYTVPKENADTETLLENVQAARDRLIFALSSIASSAVGNATSSSFVTSLDEKPNQPSNISYIQSAFATLMNAVNAAEILARLVTDGEETLTKNNEKLTISEDKYINDRLFPTDWDILRHYRGGIRPFWQAWSTIRVANELFDELDKLTEKDLEEKDELDDEDDNDGEKNDKDANKGEEQSK